MTRSHSPLASKAVLHSCIITNVYPQARTFIASTCLRVIHDYSHNYLRQEKLHFHWKWLQCFRESIVGNSFWSWKVLEQIQKRKDSRIRRTKVATSHLVIMEDINWGTPHYKTLIRKEDNLILSTAVETRSSFCWGSF